MPRPRDRARPGHEARPGVGPAGAAARRVHRHGRTRRAPRQRRHHQRVLPGRRRLRRHRAHVPERAAAADGRAHRRRRAVRVRQRRRGDREQRDRRRPDSRRAAGRYARLHVLGAADTGNASRAAEPDLRRRCRDRRPGTHRLDQRRRARRERGAPHPPGAHAHRAAAAAGRDLPPGGRAGSGPRADGAHAPGRRDPTPARVRADPGAPSGFAVALFGPMARKNRPQEAARGAAGACPSCGGPPGPPAPGAPRRAGSGARSGRRACRRRPSSARRSRATAVPRGWPRSGRALAG